MRNSDEEEEQEDEMMNNSNDAQSIISKRGPIKIKFRRFKTKNTKLNSLVQIGKTKWLSLDWDHCRYI